MSEYYDILNKYNNERWHLIQIKSFNEKEINKFVKKYPEREFVEKNKEKYSIEKINEMFESIKREYYFAFLQEKPKRTSIKKIFIIEVDAIGVDDFYLRKILPEHGKFFYETSSYYCVLKKNAVIDIYDKNDYFDDVEKATQKWIDKYNKELKEIRKKIRSLKKIRIKK